MMPNDQGTCTGYINIWTEQIQLRVNLKCLPAKEMQVAIICCYIKP